MFLCVQDLSVAGKRILVRVDFNVPQNAFGQITDDTRIRAALPTIIDLIQRGAQPILLSHLGRPEGTFVPEMTLAPCAIRLQELLGQPVAMARDCIGPSVEQLIAQGGVVLLENLRFYPGETKPQSDPSFAAELAKLGDCYVNDAFGTSHRTHTSTVKLPELFPERAALGYLVQKEVAFLSKTLLNPARPFVAIIGGAKVSSKLGVLKTLCQKADQVLVGGAMAFTFLKGRGVSIGRSLCEEELVEQTKALPVLLPIDIVAASALEKNVKIELFTTIQGIPDHLMGLDIGPATLEQWAPLIAKAKTIFWNGPVGAFETPPFERGTQELARLIASCEGTTILGGGDSLAAVNQAGLSDKMSHLSTGGGASLEYIEYGTLPGLEALSKK
ncbi:MAG: phosphoglycerate kinase [Verrucomicrobia bacterium]|nr:phosphoglycerate kinase [Verrucomicrobiota bacterium]